MEQSPKQPLQSEQEFKLECMGEAMADAFPGCRFVMLVLVPVPGSEGFEGRHITNLANEEAAGLLVQMVAKIAAAKG
jgi:hypothetical protein